MKLNFKYFFLLLEYSESFGACKTPNGNVGQCVPLRQCPTLYSILSRITLAPVEKLFLQQSQCGYIVNDPLVCCTTPDMKASASQNPQVILDPDEVRLDIESTISRSISANELPQPGECGKEEEIVVGFIVGGKQTRISESPWMALLKFSKCK